MKTKKLLSIIVSVAMIVCTLPLSVLTAFAADTVTEYYCLEVGAGAYIDTDVVPIENTRIVMDCEVKKEDTALFGTFLDWGSNNYNLFYVNSNKDFLGSGSGMNSQAWACSLLSGRRTIELAGKELKYGDTTVWTHNGAYASFGNHTAYLFAINFGSWVQTFENQFIRFYSCKIYEGDTLVREFVPAKCGDEFGVCDKKDNNKFYKNQGDGHMVAYKKVNSGSSLPKESNEGVILDFDGEITVSEDTTIIGQQGQSAIRIAPGRKVTINIKEDKTLTVNGGAAVGRFGAGAGIEVPESSSLTVCGFGTLKASGGNAAAGGVGEGGDKGWIDFDSAVCHSGRGGYGGYGGGGAGAGIGGRGGIGGLGGKGGDSVVGATAIAGLDGSPGLGGGAGEGSGNITIAETLNSVANGGAACDTQAEGGNWGSAGRTTYTHTYFAFGGGGGGAGGSGYGGAKIGSGGYGGCGGGGGGSGSDEWFGKQYKIDGCVAFGLPGGGGAGYVNGKNGKDYDKPTAYTDDYDPGNGGAGGNYGSVSEEYRSGKEKAPEYYYEIVAVPRTAENLIVYNGKEQKYIINFSDLNDKCTVEGTVSATNVGTYSATVKLKDGCIWSDGTVADKTFNWSIEKRILQAPETVYLHYTGYARIAVPDNSPDYKVYDGTATEAREEKYTARLVLNDFEHTQWNNSENDTTYVDYYIHKYTDSDGKDGCDICHGTDGYLYNVDFLDREVSEDNTVITKPSTCVAARVISDGDTLWGDETTTEKVWYVVDDNIKLTKRPTVKGNVGIVLLNGAELKANNGITLEEGNSISFYAQTDENEMGKLTADTENVIAIGGRNGKKGYTDHRRAVAGENGTGSGDVYFYGGSISLKSTDTCIDGGNGGTGEEDSHYGNNGGNGGNCGEVHFYGGNNSLESIGYCIGGGNGGNGGDSTDEDWGGGHGGSGGTVKGVYFHGGKNSLKSSKATCISGGIGGEGGKNDITNVALSGNGGNGGNCNEVHFYGGNNSLESTGACIDGGNGGNAGLAGTSRGGKGGNGGSINVRFCGGCTLLKSTNRSCLVVGTGGVKLGNPGNLNLNVSGNPFAKVGDNADNAGDFTGYTGQKYLSVNYTNQLSLTLLDGNAFTVNATGKDAGSGTVVVALYDSENKNRLLDVKVFDLENGETPSNISFDQDGYVKAFWWSNLDDIMPLCKAEGASMSSSN